MWSDRFSARLAEVLRDGLVAANDLPERTLRGAVQAGRLARVTPGWYAPPDPPLAARCLALCRHDSRAVITGRAAAALTWWPELPVPVVCAVRPLHPAPIRRFRWARYPVPSQHVWMRGELRVTDPPLTVLDLIDELGGRAIDEALRRRAVTLAQLNEALAATPNRRGNTLRRELIHDSRDEPWSEAERAFHRLLRRARLPERFRANYPVPWAGGQAFIDAALPRVRLGFEVDGYAYHGGPVAFAAGCRRDLTLAKLGWTMHHFTAAMVFDEGEWVIETVEALAKLSTNSPQLRRNVAARARIMQVG